MTTLEMAFNKICGIVLVALGVVVYVFGVGPDYETPKQVACLVIALGSFWPWIVWEGANRESH